MRRRVDRVCSGVAPNPHNKWNKYLNLIHRTLSSNICQLVERPSRFHWLHWLGVGKLLALATVIDESGSRAAIFSQIIRYRWYLSQVEARRSIRACRCPWRCWEEPRSLWPSKSTILRWKICDWPPNTICRINRRKHSRLNLAKSRFSETKNDTVPSYKRRRVVTTGSGCKNASECARQTARGKSASSWISWIRFFPSFAAYFLYNFPESLHPQTHIRI